MNNISGLVICRNEEKNIKKCLESLLWCDEIVVIDSFSTDNTIEFVKAYTDNIFQNEWKGFSIQRKFALTKASGEWIFALDADEVCSNELKQEIKSLIQNDSIPENGFDIPRKSFVQNKWIKHGGWYPNYQMRFFRKDFSGVTDRLVHESYYVTGDIGKLKNNILHYTVNSIGEYINKINTYSDLYAAEKFKKRKIGYIHILILPGIAFIQQYIFKGNFLDGIGGLIVSKFHMITKLLNYMKTLEIQNKDKSAN